MLAHGGCLAAVLLLSASAVGLADTNSPRAAVRAPVNPVRIEGTYEWCDCGTGKSSLEVWPEGRPGNKTTLASTRGELRWLNFGLPTQSINWRCSGGGAAGRSGASRPAAWWSVQMTTEMKSTLMCHRDSGRLKFAAWDEDPDPEDRPTTSVPFVSWEAGYFCIKIPVLLRLRGGDVLAFGEARRESCSDFASTDLVQKRSRDGGRTWGPLRVTRSLYIPSDPSTRSLVVGNAAPVQLSAQHPHHPGRILLPHTVDNARQWVLHSDDGGETWAAPRDISNSTTRPEWRWVATGPPGSIELSAAHPVRPFRVLTPGDHGPSRGNLGNNVVHGHCLYSDDGGDSWHLGAVGYGDSRNGTVHGDAKEGGFHFNEHQYVELGDGRVLANSRALALPGVSTMSRLQAVSHDAGASFSDGVRAVPELRNPLAGNEGSTVRDARRGLLYYSGTRGLVLRTGLSLHRSRDGGATWERVLEVDPFMSGYSSLQVHPGEDRLELLYEQSDARQLVMVPDRLVYTQLRLERLARAPPLPESEGQRAARSLWA